MKQKSNVTYENYAGGHGFFEEELNVVDYNRVSTKKEAQYYSLEDQVSANKNFIASRLKWRHIDSYVEMKSGRSIKKRKAFQELLQDAKLGKFNLIIVRDTSRFARNLKDTIVTIDELKEFGIAVYFIFEDIYSLNPNDYDRLVLMSLNAQNESDRKQQYTLMSLNFRKSNKVPILSAKTTGYTYIRRGKGVAGTYEYNDASHIVAELFYLIKGSRLERPANLDILPNVDGEWMNTIYSDIYEPPDMRKSLSLKGICEQFNKRGVTTTFNSAYWHTSTVSSIAHKIVYTGYFMYDMWEYDERQERYVFKNDNDLGISIRRNDEGVEYIEDINGVLNEGDWKPIITMKDWLDVQNILRSRRLYKDEQHPNKGRGRKPSSDIYVRRMQCGKCGGRYTKQQSRSNNPNLKKKIYLYQCTHRLVNGIDITKSDYTYKSPAGCDTKSFERVKIDYATIRVFEYIFEELKESAKIAYKMMVESYCEQGALLVERESDSVKKELEGVISNIKAMESDLKSHKIDYNIFKDLYAELKQDEANLRYQYSQLRTKEKKETPNKADIFKKLDLALQKTLTIDEELQEVDDELLNCFLQKLITKVTDDCFELTYFIDLTGEAYLKEDINFNCFDPNYKDCYELPENYEVFDSFTITKEEADAYAKKLNKRAFKSHIWNDIKVNIVLDFNI